MSQQQRNQSGPEIAWGRLFGLIAMHLGCIGLLWVSWGIPNILAALVAYGTRAFALTAFYHRYFSHRAFKTSRWFQFLGAVLGLTALQKGPLWWAAHHRHHHRRTDELDDVHSPRHFGFLWSHLGWILVEDNSAVREEYVLDWLRFPELKFLERYSIALGLVFAVGVFLAGAVLQFTVPSLGITAASLLVWVVFVSTVALYHATYSVNSLAHLFGSRRFDTKDDSRNNLLVALLTLGEGWHNNHHHYQSSARQGFAWWEVDVSYYVLVLLSKVGLVWDLRVVPRKVWNGGGA